VRASVSSYLVDLMYGFLLLEGGETVFFYLDSFDSGEFLYGSPPPIPGELVEVEVYPETRKKNRRAKKVVRVEEPLYLHGIVVKFNPKRGFGFIKWSGGECFFHLSDVKGFTIRIGTEVSFFLGKKEEKFRACYLSEIGGD